MSSGLQMALATAVTAVLLVVLLAVVLRSARSRRRLEDQLAASREELVEVRCRLDRLAQQVEPLPDVRRPVADQQEYVITTAGEPEPATEAGPPPPVSGREFASLALGESLVRLVSYGYGVKRALSAENRNRIAFEVKREVRRSRKQRRREEKRARQYLRSADRQSEVGRVAEDAA
ncbi:MAG: hypothetical protein ACTHKG_00255 [Nocardioides sp.]